MIRSYQGHSPSIPSSCYIDPSAQILGDVVLGERSSVWMNAVLRGDVNSIRVGSCSNVQDCAVLHGQRNLYPVIVGDWVTIGHNATVHGCVVEDMCVIGMGARVLNNSRIGEGLHHRRRLGRPRAHRRSAAHALGRRSRQNAPRTHRQGPRAHPRIRAELSRLHGHLPQESSARGDARVTRYEFSQARDSCGIKASGTE